MPLRAPPSRESSSAGATPRSHLALNRKNALFAGHDEGAAAWGRIASLIETAKMNRVEPYAYLKATLEAIAHGHPASKLYQHLPWAFNSASR